MPLYVYCIDDIRTQSIGAGNTRYAGAAIGNNDLVETFISTYPDNARRNKNVPAYIAGQPLVFGDQGDQLTIFVACQAGPIRSDP